jgi:hypothetical protein
VSLTAEITHLLRITEQDALTSSARTTTYRTETQKLTGATRHDAKVYTLSAGLSQVAVDLTPIVASQPGSLLWFTANAPVDVRLNDASAAVLMSAVYQLMLGMSSISSLYLTPPASAGATVRIEIIGGGVLALSTPLP